MNQQTPPRPIGTSERSGRQRPGLPVDPYRLRRALWTGKWLLIGGGVLGVTVGFLWVKLAMSRWFETTAVLKYEGELRVAGLPMPRDAIEPAADALSQQSVLRKIAEESGFEGSLTALESTIGFKVNSWVGTMDVTVSGDTPEEATEFARVVTGAFMAYHKERQSRRIEEEIAHRKKRIDAAASEADVARRRYNEFREEHGIGDLSTEQQSVVESAARLKADSELAALETGALEAQVRALETELSSTPKTSFVSAGSSPERATYDRLREELVSARATLSAEHPRVQALQQQVDQLRAQVRSGGGASSPGDGLVGANATYQVVEGQLRDAKSRLAALRERREGLSEMADKAQRRVEGFSDIEAEASGLLADVNVHENLLSELLRTQTLLEDALRDPPSGFVVLDPGAVPEYPVRNKKKRVVFVLIFTLGVGLVTLFVLRGEFQNLRLETTAEVAFWGNGPVLASTTWPDDPQGLDELVAGLDDVFHQAKGSLLIVGGSPSESGSAKELADRINDDWFSTSEATRLGRAPVVTPPPPAPLQTPPPSGPYTVSGSGTRSAALARQPLASPMALLRLPNPPDHVRLEAWEGPLEGQALRRAARLADRVVILVRSGAMSAPRLNGVRSRIGRETGIGYIVVGLPDELRALPDRVGNVAAFWRS